MTEEEFEQEVRFYQQAIRDTIAHVDLRLYWSEAAPELSARFNILLHNDLFHGRLLCIRLLSDGQRDVRLGAIKLIGSYDKKGDSVLSLALIQLACRQKDLREEALYAVWHVRTRYVLPQLLSFADKGYSSALYMIRPLLQTPEEIQRAILIAHKYIDASDYELREAALFLLQRYSTMEQEAERVLAAVQRYTDELFIDALKKAPLERVLEPLKALRATFPERSAEYGDLSSTIKVLEQRNHEGDEYKEGGGMS